MNMARKKLYFLFTIVLSALLSQQVLVVGQTNKIYFNHHTVENGLSQSSVLSITQDKTGFMWFGTKDGLNKFNTQTFEVFKHKENDSTSLSSSQNINALLTDHKGNLWVGTQKGLNLYIPESNSFKHFFNQPGENPRAGSIIRSLFEDKQGNLWVGMDNGLYRLLKNGKFQRVEGKSADGTAFKNQQVKSIYQDHLGLIWIAATEGLTSIIVKNNGYDFKTYLHDPKNPNSIIDNDISSVIEDNAHNLWIGTHQSGLEKLDRKTGIFRLVYTPDGLSTYGMVIRKLALDKAGRLWIGMLSGIYLFDPLKNEFILLKHDAEAEMSLNQNSVYDIYQDASGSMWVGTYYGGVNVYHENAIPFRSYKNYLNKNSISSNVISAVVEDDRHNLWIGTEAEGLNYYDRSAGRFRSFKNEAGNPASLSSNLIKAIAIDRKKNVWVGTYEGGLDLWLPPGNTFKHYFVNSADSNLLISRRIVCLLYDGQNRLWVGTRAHGIYLYNAEQDRFFSCKNLFPSNHKTVKQVRYLFEDSKHTIWAATNRGTYRLSLLAGKFQKFKVKDSAAKFNEINVITEDKKHNIWLGGYEQGLIKYVPGQHVIKSYTTGDGLPSNVILGILEDAKGALWVSTDNGLSKFESGSFKIYTVKDGLPGNVFNYNSQLKDSRGEMFFGGYNGLLSFYPEQIKDNIRAPKAVFISLRLFNKPVVVGDGTGLLNKNINLVQDLTFSHEQNIFNIDFAVLNYIKPEKNKYAYKLEGFEKEWNYVSSPSATFTNLPSGNYSLLIKGTNNDGVWSAPARLNIYVAPAFWQTWWAYLFYVLLFSGLLFLVLRFIWMRALLKREQEVHQMKLDFFTNVSHEIRMPLTLIVGPLEMLIKESQEFPVLNRKLLGVKKNAGRLTRLVNELMDFRKAESGKMTLSVSPGNLVNFCREIFFSFRYLADKHHINYKFESEHRRVEVYFDKFQLEKVIFNLLSNAFKFTPDHGTIRLTVSPPEHGRITVVVSDSGIGIARESRLKIFTNFYQVKDHTSRNSGTGIGLALSKKIAQFHYGDLFLLPQSDDEVICTSFCLELKLGSAHFKSDELITPYLNTDNPILYQDTPGLDLTESMLAAPEEEQVHVLIVEDNEEVRALIRQSLEQHYQIIEAVNGKQGMELALEKIPDLIVSDVMMPEMDGLELCGLLKTDQRTSHIPVILLTARSGNIHEVSGLKTGADAYITKPFGVNVLQLTIHNLLKLQASMRKKFSQQMTLQPSNVLIESSDEEFLNKVMKLIEGNLVNGDFSVNTLASEIGMSTPVLYRKIKVLTGMTVNNFVKSVRLKRAAQLLKQNSNTVYEVAYMVGFNDSKYFSKEFAKQFGLTPSEYALA